MTGRSGSKHPHLRTAVATATALLLAATATGCATENKRCGPAPSSRYRATDLHGTWSSLKGHLKLSDLGGKLGQTFNSQGWPKNTTLDQTVNDAPLEGGLFGKGTWSLSTDHTTLTLTFDRLDAELERTTIHTLRIGEEKNQPVLYTRVGDPEECHVFALTRQGD
ncbi:hypothetical protein OEIGOIKO_04278 [Streptomyces chrestomyceticus JCM 4735]|uniref:Lipoprotein n=1 Tax=Streptomyces chrestomyceticus JCM 4735 TaxID=1306181 RepID=A0A7U9PZ63_9ACTN|nr:hypothetical protein [Streptomyces chrestomyceticus]GCD36515.1 hypothetical protein OEIGOIKO_04278 [Streptomyces chrestomyceticus JCM 4735]